MARELVYTLVSEGSSDEALIPIISWAIRQIEADVSLRPQFAGRLSIPDGDNSLQRRAFMALRLYPADLLFVHRDADAVGPEKRVNEIQNAISKLEKVSAVPIIPVRMTEAWLFLDESAIRKASGNSNGTCDLDLPPVAKWETLADPKERLIRALKTASEKRGRRLQSFDEFAARRRIAELVNTFTPLRQLKSFRQFEERLADVMNNLAEN